HLSVPEIAAKILDDWKIKHVLRLDKDHDPKLELRVQYGESDYAFLTRQLEEAGISFFFEDDLIEGSRVVLHDRPHLADPREAPPLPFFASADMAKSGEREY